jgi:hypothetical protein
MTLSEAKNFLRVDDDEDNALISSLIITAKILTEEIIRKPLEEFTIIPEPINQAMLILIATLYEERQVRSDPKSGLSLDATLDLVKKMLFAYRKEAF